jgi:PAS domain S-box-containing protein
VPISSKFRGASHNLILARAAGAVTVVFGAMMLIGRVFDLGRLAGLSAEPGSMNRDTAICFIFCGLSLWLLRSGLAQASGAHRLSVRASQACALVVGLGGLIVLADRLLSLNPGIDELLIPNALAAAGAIHPGEVPSLAALCFIFLGTALLVASQPIPMRIRLPILAALGLVVTVTGGLALGGYAAEGLLGIRWWNFIGIHFYTAGGFVLMGIGLLALFRSERPSVWLLDIRTTIGFVLGMALMIATAAVSSMTTGQLIKSVQSVSHTQEVLKEIEGARADIVSLQSEQRGYMIGRGPHTLDRLTRAKGAIREHLANIRQLTSANPKQSGRLNQIQPLVDQYLKWTDRTIAAGGQPGNQAGPGIAADEEEALTGGIWRQLDDMEGEEYLLLHNRQSRSDMASSAVFLLLPLSVILTLTILSLGLSFFNEEAYQRALDRAALTESEFRFRTLIENSHDVIIVTDAEGHRQYVSPTVERLLGYTVEEYLKGTIFDIAHEEDIPDLRRFFDEIRANPRKPVTGTFRARHKDGSWRWIETVGANFFDIPGLRGIVVNYQDVTARRDSEAELVRERLLLRTLIDNLPDAIYAKDTAGRKTLANLADLKNLRVKTEADAIGKTDFDLFPQEIAARFFASDQAIFRTGQPLIDQEEPSLVGLEGKSGWLLTTKVPLRDESGKIIGLVGIGRDITQRKLAEEQIREQATLLDQASDAIMVEGLDRRISYWNKGAERIYGWTGAEARGRRIDELLHGDKTEFEKVRTEVLEKDGWTGELRQTRKDGGEVAIEASWTLVRDANGRPKSILAINTDITERKKLQMQFLRNQRMEGIGTLAAGIAHDLNNVLAPIVISVDLLGLRTTDPESLKLLDDLRRTAKRGANIVRQVLFFARGVEGEHFVLTPERLVEELIAIISGTFPKNIAIKSRFGEKIQNIRGDPTQLHQVLLNLCINARDAMPQGGTLALEAKNVALDEAYATMNPESKAGAYVEFLVADTGEGMKPEILNKVFEPFFTTKEVGKGTGLGLSTVAAIVKGHHGFITLNSALGQGTVFKFYLPAEPIKVEEPLPVETGRFPRGNGELILVVDDEELVLDVAAKVLQHHGYKVITAPEGATAVALYEEHMKDIAVVLTDMTMPVMDGAAAIRAMKRINPDVKVIAASGLGSKATRGKMEDAGIKHVLSKPYTSEVLLKTLQTVIRS